MSDQETLSVPSSVRTLLTGVVDYAGLFPPSAVSMSEAVLNYATYRNSNYCWMLGRFVLATSRLEEFINSAGDFTKREREGDPWRLAIVAASPEDLATIADFNRTNGAHAVGDTVEIKAQTPDDIRALAERSQGLTVYVELALNADLPEMVATLAETGLRAKIRTGGITPDAFPTSTDIIRFVKTCLAANVPFKATAGLHHPIRCFRPLTYAADAPTGTMHGFLNLFLMSGFAREGYRQQLLEEMMEEEFEEVFRFEEQSAVWRDDHRLTVPQIERLRATGIQSFGSCSFDEPVEDLRKLGIL